ncbi:dimethyl sulfoxide reductase subunit A, partial [Salmonella enterica subsp. enterica serovar Montevideo]|nr:dimethyl sulfoxide reductase subunit A [Salmonella enterica subsp. enterica serovar Montevideo]
WRGLGVIESSGVHLTPEYQRFDAEAHFRPAPQQVYDDPRARCAATWELPEGDVIDPLPIYTPGFENYNDPLTDKFPLQLTGFHY